MNDVRAATEPEGVLYRAEGICLLLFSAAIFLSISVMEITFLTALAIRLVRWARGERPRTPALYLLTGALLLVSWLLASAFAPAAETGASFRTTLRLYQLLVVPVLLEHAANSRETSRLLLAYAAGAAISSLFGLWNWYERLQTEPWYRLEGVFSTAMTSGNVFAIAVAGLWTYAWRVGMPAARWLAGGLVLSLAALIATLTRSSWLGAGTGAAWGILWARRRGWAVVALALAVLVAGLVPTARQRATVLADASETTARGRISLWRSGLEIFAERPMTGWGLADKGERIRAYRRADATFEAGHFHSNPVQIAVGTGVVGLIAYTLFHAALGLLLWRRRSSPFALAAFAAWLAFHVAGFFDWSFGDAEVAYQYFWWMGVGLGAAASR